MNLFDIFLLAVLAEPAAWASIAVTVLVGGAMLAALVESVRWVLVEAK